MIAGYALRYGAGVAFGAVMRYALMAVGVTVIGYVTFSLNSCTAKLEAAGAAKYRSAVLSAVAKDNAEQADAQRERLTLEREANARARARWKDREAGLQSRLADLRQQPEDGFQCPDADTWKRLQRCPYSP